MDSKIKRAVLIGLCGFSLGLAASSALAQSACAAISSISGVAAGAGATNGIPGTFLPGDTVQIAATFGTADAATFRIVGNSTGSPTLAGPIAVPGTLSYSVTGPLPAGSIGIGYFIDTANGTVNIAASCTNATSVPTLAEWNVVLLALALLTAGWAVIRRRMRA
jgi:hypothetical protein